MKSLGMKTRIALVIAIIILALGIVMVSVFGFNKTSTYKNGWEISVKADNIDTSDNERTIIKQETDAYLNELGVKIAGVRYYDEGCWYVVSFNEDYKDVIDVTTLQNNIKSKFTGILAGVDVEVAYNDTVKYVYGQKPVSVVLAVLIIAVFVFGYTLLTEKTLASAVAVLCSSIISALLFFAAVALFRIPAEPFIAVGCAAALLFGEILSFALVNRFKEEIRLANTDKPNLELITATGVKKSVLRISVTAAGIAVLGGILVGFGLCSDLMWAGVQLILVSACSAFTAITATPLIWKLIKTAKESKAVKANVKEEK